jgi:DNA repair exonuclease SbcCD ATPase subunit
VSGYDDALNRLYRAPFGEFVNERKRLSAELKAGGDKAGAAKLGKLARPPVSAWAVNQLWWTEQSALQALIDAAGRVKVGDREASKLHKEALNRLRAHAARLLQEAGNAATEPTLRRVTTTLSAVAAAGGFAPDLPGMLATDRDPPGFEALGFASETATSSPATKQPTTSKAKHDSAVVHDLAAKRAEEAEKRRREDEQRKARLAERERLSGALREARELQTTQQHELSRLRTELETAEQNLKKTQALLAELEEKLADLSG